MAFVVLHSGGNLEVEIEERINRHITNHQEVYIRKQEGNKSVIFFIHCMFGSPRYFNDYIDLIPEEWDIHSTLLKGHGGTPWEYATSHMSEWKQQINEEYERLSKEYDNIYLLSHSLGTLFSINLANAYPEKIKGMFLLSAPMRPILTWRMLRTGFKLLVFRNTTGDIVAEMAEEKYSISLTKNLLIYLGYLHNYVTLFEEIFEVRKHTKEITVPFVVVYSKFDELVRLEAQEYFQDMENGKILILENSYHFYYEDSDYKYLREQFVEFCKAVKI